MSIYEELKPVATELLNEFKQGDIDYIKITPGNGSADEPGTSTETKTKLAATVKGVSFKYLQNNFAVASDKTVTCAVVDGLTPAIGDFIDVDGERFKIIQDISPPASGIRVVWKFIVRKGG